MEVVQLVSYIVKLQNPLCNEDKMPHNKEKVCVASYVSYKEYKGDHHIRCVC